MDEKARKGLEYFLDALATGDSTGAVLRQKARGQAELQSSDTLPRDCNVSRPDLQAVGFQFGADVDDLFVSVTLPAGWKKVPTKSSYWTDLVDEKGRKRADIFYKAAFYDRVAHIRFSMRYFYHDEPVGGWGQDNYRKLPFHYTVCDGKKILWESPHFAREDYAAGELYKKQASDFINENYPDWKNPLAYWD